MSVRTKKEVTVNVYSLQVFFQKLLFIRSERKEKTEARKEEGATEL